MTHEQFVEKWSRGEIEVQVDRSLALQIANSNLVPKRYRYAHIFWSWVWMLSMPGAIAVAIWGTWWVGLLLLFVLSPLLFKATRKAACQFVIDHAKESEDFYDFVREQGVLSIAT